MKRILKTTLIAGALALFLSSPLMAKEVASVGEARQEVARTVASLVKDPAFDQALRGRLSRNTATLADVLRNYAPGNGGTKSRVTDTLRDLDRQAIRLRGLEGSVSELIDLRLLNGANGQPTATGGKPWIATLLKNPSTGQKELVAYDPAGIEHRYPADAAPAVPMLLVESTNARAMSAGMQVMNEAMRNEGLQTNARRSNARSAASPEDLSILTDIYLAYDEEKNISGAAEVFAIVSGVSPEGKAQVINLSMEYLDHDKHWYTPKQDLIAWRNFGPSYVNVQLFEDDGNTNFKKIAQAVIGAVGDVSGLIDAPTGLIIDKVGQIATKVIEAMPNSWFENTPDYIDTFYVIEPHTYATRENPLIGAAENAKIGIMPYRVGGQELKAVADKTEDAKTQAMKGR